MRNVLREGETVARPQNQPTASVQIVQLIVPEKGFKMTNKIKREDIMRERNWMVSRKDIFDLDSSNSSSTTQEIMKSNEVLYPNTFERFLYLACAAPSY